MLNQLDTLIAFALIMLLLSLLIMTVVQGANVLLQRRGRHLLWGVAQILKQMGADETSANAIAKRVLLHPAVSPSQMVYASAIRADELARLLREVMNDPSVCPANMRTADWYTRLVDTSATVSANSLEQITAQRAVDPQAMQVSLHTVVEALDAPIRQVLTNAGVQQADRTAEQLRDAVEMRLRATIADTRQTAADLKAWFNMIMDRTTESFVAWTRSITIAVSIVFCLMLQVDALEILEQLSTDKELRAKLVAQVEPTLEQAEGIIAPPNGANALGTQAIKNLHDKLKADPKTAGDAKLIENVPADLDTQEKGEMWLKQAVTDPAKQASIIKQYKDQFTALNEQQGAKVAAQETWIADQISKTQLTLFKDALCWKRYCEWRHWLGMIVAAFFLGLGAPFWFNTLRNLANLRPILASRVQPEREK
jgi:hypothetical protein